MFSKQEEVRVWIYRSTLDMRIGFDRLAEKIKMELERSAIKDGAWYVFFGKKRDRVKIFYWDRDGYAMWMKRLEAGSFKVERAESGYEELTSLDLKAVLDGVELSRIKLQKSAEKGLFN